MTTAPPNHQCLHHYAQGASKLDLYSNDASKRSASERLFDRLRTVRREGIVRMEHRTAEETVAASEGRPLRRESPAAVFLPILHLDAVRTFGERESAALPAK